MKNHFRLLITIGTFAFLQAMSAGLAESTQTVVTGTGDPAQDVKAVQDAVDKGGTVLLRGRFNFGEKGQIKITRDIKIRGERGQEGTPVTAISGGFLTFFSPLPNEIPLQMPGPKITIQDLHFDAATWAPICISYSSGAVITGNKITNVKPFLGTMPVFGRTDIYRQHGIVLVPRYGGAKGYLSGAVTGTAVIADNDIDLTCENSEKTMSQGVFIVEATGLDAHVLRNRIVNCSRNSIEALDNYRDNNGKGIAIIQGNKIVTSTVGCPVPGPTNHPNGIVVGWFLDPNGGQDPIRNSKVVIVDNQIEARGEFASGVISLGDGISIASNEIVMDGGRSIW